METLADLSQRETQLLLMAAEGQTDYSIAAKLGISVATVNSYWVRIRSKLDAQSRTEAVALALRSQSEAKLRKLQSENERLAQELADATTANGESTPAAFGDLLKAAADGILIVSPDAKILACNPALADMFGYKVDELVGQPLSSLVPDRHREGHIEYIESYFEAPSRRRMGHHLFTPGRKKDGSEFAVSVTLGAAETQKGNYTVCMVRDATPEWDLIRQHAPGFMDTLE